MAWSKKYSPACNRRRGWRRAYSSKASALRITPLCFSRRATVLLDAPCGRSTNTPCPAKPWYGCSMQSHIQAAAPATASNSSTVPTARILFNSASSFVLAAVDDLYLSILPVSASFIEFCGHYENQTSYVPAGRKAQPVKCRPCRLDALWAAFSHAPLLQVFLSNYGCGDSIDGRSGRSALAFAVRFRIMQNSSRLLF